MPLLRNRRAKRRSNPTRIIENRRLINKDSLFSRRERRVDRLRSYPPFLPSCQAGATSSSSSRYLISKGRVSITKYFCICLRTSLKSLRGNSAVSGERGGEGLRKPLVVCPPPPGRVLLPPRYTSATLPSPFDRPRADTTTTRKTPCFLDRGNLACLPACLPFLPPPSPRRTETTDRPTRIIHFNFQQRY